MTKSKHALSMTALVIVSLQLLFLALTTSLLSPASELSTSNQVRSPSTLRVTPRLLHDKTLDWDPAVRRAWLDPTIPHKPPAMLLLTNFGWNHPNQTYGKQVYRNIRTRELVNGIINHPWFHPTAFQDLQEGTMQLNNSTRYYIFLDKHSCGEKNYPIYGKGLEGVRHNRDTRHGRGNCCIDQKNHYTKQVMESKVMQAQSATFILFECSGIGPKLKPEFKRDRQSFPGKKLAFISLSAIHPHLIPDHDQGLVPPALQPCDESILEPEPVCHRRPILLSFAGKISRSIARLDLETLNNDQDIMVGGHEKAPKWMKMPLQELGKAFRKLASLSDFGAAPRGDNLFSYRLTETMSCGAIPVVYADEWKLPFGERLVDWSSVAVRIPEKKTNRSREYLSRFSDEQVCAMRERVKKLYKRYMQNGDRIIAGIIDNFEFRANSSKLLDFQL